MTDDDLIKSLRREVSRQQALGDEQNRKYLSAAFEVANLKDDLAYVASMVDGWPVHPWIPGVNFIGSERLRSIITKWRAE